MLKLPVAKHQARRRGVRCSGYGKLGKSRSDSSIKSAFSPGSADASSYQFRSIPANASSIDHSLDLTSDGLRQFSYDAANRLAQVQINRSSEAAKVTYLHNALGQRIFKSEPQVAQTAPDESELGLDFISWLKKNFGWLFTQAQHNATLGQSFVYADGPLGPYNLLGEYGNGGNKGAGRIEYLWLPGETGQAQLIGLYRNNRFYAIHADPLGTPRLITDDTGKAVWQWPYSAFGDNPPSGILKATANPTQAYTNQPVLLKATKPAIEVNLRYPGQYFDEESDLSYNYFRSYQPSQGRYSQPDPIGLAGGWNRFAYVEGNPLSFTDPDGLQASTPGYGPHRPIPPNLNPQPRQYPIFPNGNYVHGFTSQDGVCTLPGAIGRAANSNACVSQCCKVHDDCYTRNGCNASSWNGNISGGFRGACQQCNAEAASCIVSATTK